MIDRRGTAKALAMLGLGLSAWVYQRMKPGPSRAFVGFVDAPPVMVRRYPSRRLWPAYLPELEP
jgi:hypothetical protein